MNESLLYAQNHSNEILSMAPALRRIGSAGGR
jgi:hypothetical protein